MSDRGPKDIVVGQPQEPSSPTDSLPGSSDKQSKPNNRRKSKQLSDPPSLETGGTPQGQQNTESPTNSPTEKTEAPGNKEGDQSNNQERPQNKGSKMPETPAEVDNLKKGAGEKAGGVTDTAKEITTGGMNMKIDDPDLQWETPEKSGSLQIRIRLNLRAKVQLNLDARVKGEVVIGLL
ncbi:hypothetical protein AbraIFM66950_009333 [Aspergillus brasiliensis]|nr:hypothetical protein AbraIFM66950_009333 [Aspergillus brasiliensis]